MSRTEQMISIQKKMEFKIKVSPPHPAWLIWSPGHWPGSSNGHPLVSVQCQLPEAILSP